jgi:hypothetical protein
MRHKRLFHLFSVFLGFVLLGVGVGAPLVYGREIPTATTPTAPDAAAPSYARPDPVSGGVYLYRRDDAVLANFMEGIFGPKICTAYGDPFSPLYSPWAPGLYTYTYRIFIPDAYPEDLVRVELFDPDSINSDEDEAIIIHTQAAQDLGGMPPTEIETCYPSQEDPCILDTGEAGLLDDGLGLEFEDINPYWFMRVDENRGQGPGDGDGTCGGPGSYTPRYNTQTVYQLYYYAEDGSDTGQRIDLATYTGQVGDGVRDSGDHDTDLRWVSPGAPLSYDQTALVPANCGSANGGDDCDGDGVIEEDDTPGSGFEVSLSDDLAGIRYDAENDGYFLYLDVTAISGASENGFALWAGPPYYTNTVPSAVNSRNYRSIDAPGSHTSLGVTVQADRYRPTNSVADYRVDLPVTYLGPEYAGQTVTVSLFDSDAGANPPLYFYFDSINRSDWEVEFSPSASGAAHSCYPGGCNNQWATPPYTITLPDGLVDCDYSGDPANTCTPFYGGRLIANYDGGRYDTHAWEVNTPDAPAIDDTRSCAAFPMAVGEGVRSVNPPGASVNPYPDAAEFDNPNPPAYDQFVHHTPDAPLSDAEEGDVYLLYNGFGSGDFGWLVWNEGINASANTLVNSLAWPGNTLDYTDHNDGGQALGAFDHVVRGYIDPDDTSDLTLGVDDWVPASTGVINQTGVRDALNEHISKTRTLRLPIWDQARDVGVNADYQVARFAIFRLHGYHVSTSPAWILLEFVRWDDSCGQFPTPLAGVALAGPESGTVGTVYPFTATVSPATAAQPITYRWRATGQAPITGAAGLIAIQPFTWTMTGTQAVTVTAVNDAGLSVTDTHTITLTAPPQPLQAVTLAGPESGLIGANHVFTATAGPVTATQPITYHWQAMGQEPLTSTTGLTDTQTFNWTITGTKGVTVTAVNDAGLLVTDAHTITLDAPPQPLQTITLAGPESGLIDAAHLFTATTGPVTATQPITYHWRATGQDAIIGVGGLMNTRSFTWTITGTKIVTVTAVNPAGFMVTDTHTITLDAPDTLRYLYLPVALKPD